MYLTDDKTKMSTFIYVGETWRGYVRGMWRKKRKKGRIKE